MTSCWICRSPQICRRHAFGVRPVPSPANTGVLVRPFATDPSVPAITSTKTCSLSAISQATDGPARGHRRNRQRRHREEVEVHLRPARAPRERHNPRERRIDLVPGDRNAPRGGDACRPRGSSRNIHTTGCRHLLTIAKGCRSPRPRSCRSLARPPNP